MIELALEQGTEEWHNARLGIPTASRFDMILTPKTLDPSAQARRYLCEKVAERLIGIPMDFGTAAMQRGSEIEESAVAWWEFQSGKETRKSGLCLTDDRRVGCSVDRFIGDDGILEIKCPLAPGHLDALLFADPMAHRLQKQGQLWVTGRKWVELLSYFPELPPAQIYVERDEEVIARLEEEVGKFNEMLDTKEKWCRAVMGQTVAA